MKPISKVVVVVYHEISDNTLFSPRLPVLEDIKTGNMMKSRGIIITRNCNEVPVFKKIPNGCAIETNVNYLYNEMILVMVRI